ncbi:MAG: glycosyltransferase family 2 protein [Betaproteobacteria bacterium]|nr:glycosyltransferase family 2 protein [Betaproteobacteria bacterium]
MKARPIVVTLTSIPPRFENLSRKLASLDRQTVKPDFIELYLARSYRRFPGPRPALPTLPPSVRVVEVEHDLGPATKVLPACQRWQSEDVDLLLCDDDRAEDPDWVERFARARHERPDDIICEAGWFVDSVSPHPRTELDLPRVQVSPRLGKNLAYRLKRLLTLQRYTPKIHIYSQSGYADVFMGVYGAMMSPRVFHPDAWEIPDILWTVDDVWLSGMARANGNKVWVNAVARTMPRDSRFDRTSALKDHVEQGVDRDGANRMCIDYLRDRYGIWR